MTRRAPYPFPPAPRPAPAMVRWGCRWGAVAALALPIVVAANIGAGRPPDVAALSAMLTTGIITAPPYRRRRR